MVGCRHLRVFGAALAMGMALAGSAHASHHKHRKIAHHGRLSGYSSLSAARSACHTGGVVWHARGSKVFHGSRSRYFGKTKHGAYVCQSKALADHLRAAKN